MMADIQNIMEGDRPKTLAEFKEIFNKCIDQYLADTPSDCVISQEKAEQILKVLQNDPDCNDSELKSYVKQDKLQLQDFPLLQLKNVLCTVKKGRKTANRLNDDMFGRFRRVVLKEEFFDMIYKAHSQRGNKEHIGFEKTIFQLKRNYSHIPCEIVLKFMKMCPVCAGTVPEENIPLFCVKYEDDMPSKTPLDPAKYIRKEKPKAIPKKVPKVPKTTRKVREKATKATARVRMKSRATNTAKRTKKPTGTMTTTRTIKRETTSVRQGKPNTNTKANTRISGCRMTQQDHDYVRNRHYLPITYSLAGPRSSSLANFRDYSNNQRVHVLRASYFMAVGKVSIIDIEELQGRNTQPYAFTQLVHYIDLWSKYSIMWPLREKKINCLASGIAKNVFAYFGAPRQLIYNDCSMQQAEHLQTFLRVWSSQVNVTTSILEEPLAPSGPLHWRIYDSLKNLPPESWETYIPKLQFLANTQFVKTHGTVSPFEAVFGHPALTETFTDIDPIDTHNKTPANENMTTNTNKSSTKQSNVAATTSVGVTSDPVSHVTSTETYQSQSDPLPTIAVPVACTINIANRSTRSLLPSTLTLLHSTAAPSPTSDTVTFVVSKMEPTGDSDILPVEVDNTDNNSIAATTPITTTTTTTTAVTTPPSPPLISAFTCITATTPITATTFTNSSMIASTAGTPTVKIENMECGDGGGGGGGDDDNDKNVISSKPAVDNNGNKNEEEEEQQQRHQDILGPQTTISVVETVDAAISMIKLQHLEKDKPVTDSPIRKRILKKPILKLPSNCKNTNPSKLLRRYQHKMKQNFKTFTHYKTHNTQHRTVSESLPNCSMYVECVGGSLPKFPEPDPEEL